MTIPRARDRDHDGKLEAALPRTFVSEQMRGWVDATAAEEGVSVGDIIREALRQFREGRERAAEKKLC